MPSDFPHNSDGDALRGLVERGSDLSKPMLMDFQIAAHTEEAANAIGELAILTFPILAATVVLAFTNPRLGKIKFMSAVAQWAQ